MYFDNNKYPILNLLKSKPFGPCYAESLFHLEPIIKSFFKEIAADVKVKDVVYFSLSALDKIEECALSQEYNYQDDDLPFEKGVFLSPALQYIYDFNRDDCRLIIMQKDVVIAYLQIEFDFENNTYQFSDSSFTVDRVSNEYTDDLHWLEADFSGLLISLRFKHYVCLQNKIMETGKAGKKSISKNKSGNKSVIQIIDSTYWTNFIKIAATTRKAHRRHYKSGKIVEIKATTVSAYQRNAKKLEYETRL